MGNFIGTTPNNAAVNPYGNPLMNPVNIQLPPLPH